MKKYNKLQSKEIAEMAGAIVDYSNAREMYCESKRHREEGFYSGIAQSSVMLLRELNKIKEIPLKIRECVNFEFETEHGLIEVNDDDLNVLEKELKMESGATQ